MAVVCGIVTLPYDSWINKNMPMWVFPMGKDTTVTIEESETIVVGLRKLGYDVKFTKYPNIGHNAWVKGYENEALYEWFMEQKLPE